MNLLSYIQGNRKGKEAHRIEKEAMRDPFLADALEGFDTVKADHIERISHLRSHISSAKRNSGQHKIYLGIAASLLFCFMLGGYYLLNKRSDNLVAVNTLQTKNAETDFFIEEEEIALSDFEIPEPSEEKVSTRLNRQQTVTTHPPLTSVAEQIPTTSVADNLQQTATAQIPLTSISAENQKQMEEQPPLTSLDEQIPTTSVAEENQKQMEEQPPLTPIKEQIPLTSLDEQIPKTSVAEENQKQMEEQPPLTPIKEQIPLTSLDEQIPKTSVAEAIVSSRARSLRLETAKPSVPQPEIGMKAYEKYLKEAKLPLQDTACANTKGTVEVEFTIKEGKPTNFIIRQSLCPASDKEAIRLIENGCNWTGADGQKVVLKVSF